MGIIDWGFFKMTTSWRMCCLSISEYPDRL